MFVKFYPIKLLFLLFISTQLIAQDIHIKNRVEDITIKNDSSFIKDVVVLLKANTEAISFPIFYDADLETVENIQVYTKKGKRFKLEKNKTVFEEDVKLDYIANKKIKAVIVPPEVEAKITYSIKCKELMYFSSLRFFSNNRIDTLKYQITVPNSFRFVHNAIYKDSLDYMAIDSLKQDNFTKWSIEAIPIKVEPNPMLLFGIYKNIRVPLMRTLVIPNAFSGNEKSYMNNWYFNKVATKRGLNIEVTDKIDEITKGVSDSFELMRILYDYVRKNFKYVAIEIGMGAFIPSHANEVFENKQGDCKDLSNFLSEILKYKGIKSNVALAATSNHITDCDFPSLSSANHVICVAYINDKPILLDPTDPIHVPKTPVQSLQKRTILIINDNDGEFFTVNGFSTNQNLIKYKIELEANSAEMLMQGDFETSYGGITGNFLSREFIYKSSDEINELGQNHFESVFNNLSVTDFKVVEPRDKIKVAGDISVKGKIFRDGNNKFLFIDFLPRIIETESRETLLEGTQLGSSFSKIVNLRIKMDEIFIPFNPIEHNFSEKGVSLSMKISALSDSIIECKYKFVNDYISIEKENLNITNTILKSFKKIVNEPIIIKNKI